MGILLPLLFVAFTPSESQGSPIAVVIRVLGFLGIASVMVFRGKKDFRLTRSSVTLLLTVLFLIGLKNLTAPSPFLLIVISVYCAAFFIGIAVVSSASVRCAMHDGLGLLLFVWAAGLLLQHGIYWVWGDYLPFHEWAFPLSEQRGGRFFEVLRMGGVHIEPGTYANWVYGTCMVRAALSRSLFNKVNTFSIATVPLTLSFWGILAFCVYFGALMIASSKSVRSFFGFACALVLIGWMASQFWDFLFPYLESRSALEDISGAAKIEFVDGLWRRADDWLLWGRPFSESPCGDCLSPQDAGILPNGLFFFGLGFALVAALTGRHFFRLYGVPGLLCSVPLAFTKYFYWDPLAVMLITIILFDASRRSAEVGISLR